MVGFLKFVLGWAIAFGVLFGTMAIYRSCNDIPLEGDRIKGAPLSCSKLTDNRAKIDCMAEHCLFDDRSLNAAHCNAR